MQDLFQMGATSYPGMTQPFSMGHTSNMSSVGVRQDSMGNFIEYLNVSSMSRRIKPFKYLNYILEVIL